MYQRSGWVSSCELAATHTEIQQEVPGSFSAPGAEVDFLGDGAVEVVVAVFGPGVGCYEAGGVNLRDVEKLTSAEAVVGQQVLEDIGEQVDGITSGLIHPLSCRLRSRH